MNIYSIIKFLADSDQITFEIIFIIEYLGIRYFECYSVRYNTYCIVSTVLSLLGTVKINILHPSL